MTGILFLEKEETRMKVVRKWALGLLLAAALTCLALSASAQNPPQLVPGNQQGFWYAPQQANPYQLQTESAQLAKQYVEAKEGEKSDIRKHLTEVLNHQFDQHIQEQQKELNELEKRLTHLKEVLRKRLDAKSTIVERHAEQLIQDAAGLGWNAPSSPHITPDGSYFGWGNKNGPTPKPNPALQKK
jgi:hypothetical protein